ncbi:MAG TPA: FKBP-type peptidyl-prolyl cis-trans isomerase [Candidatus Enterocola sp.]|jgi:FKBP-type peptidyl-prolyl cis-trans isomerase FklB|nr:FKBP-type peptidyl-prolyl cis-trans isomerase [Candidatus Enterocola sp.]
MKKTAILTVLAVAAGLLMTSCNNKSVKVESNLDSISYAAGIVNSYGLTPYLSEKMEIDTTYMDEVIRGIKEASGAKSEKEKAYLAGLQIGSQIQSQIPYMNESIFSSDTLTKIDEKLFYEAFFASLKKDSLMMNVEDASSFIKAERDKRNVAEMEKLYGSNKQAGIAFLNNNKTQEGVVETASGLQYKVVKMGNGAKPLATDRVKVNYHGTLIDGTVFDSSVERGTPAEFGLNQVIQGWTEGLQLMPVGSKFTFYVPYQLGYNDRESGSIKPYSTLIFDVELLEIVKK